MYKCDVGGVGNKVQIYWNGQRSCREHYTYIHIYLFLSETYYIDTQRQNRLYFTRMSECIKYNIEYVTVYTHTLNGIERMLQLKCTGCRIYFFGIYAGVGKSDIITSCTSTTAI